MGYFEEFKCKKCGYNFEARLGTGFFHSEVKREITNAALRGELGKKFQKFFKENSSADIDFENVVAKCTECGKYATISKVTIDPPIFSRTYYTSKEGVQTVIKKYLVAKYPNKCEHCGGTMKFVDAEEHLICPDCKIEMETVGFGMWD